MEKSPHPTVGWKEAYKFLQPAACLLTLSTGALIEYPTTLQTRPPAATAAHRRALPSRFKMIEIMFSLSVFSNSTIINSSIDRQQPARVRRARCCFLSSRLIFPTFSLCLSWCGTLKYFLGRLFRTLFFLFSAVYQHRSVSKTFAIHKSL